MNGYTDGGLRAAIIEDVGQYMFKRQLGDIRNVISRAESFNDNGIYYTTVSLPIHQGVRGYVQVCIYPKDKDDTSYFVDPLTPSQILERSIAMELSALNLNDKWAKKFLLRIAEFMKTRFSFTVTGIISPYISESTQDRDVEVTEVLGFVPFLGGDAIFVGIEHRREISR